MENKYSHLNTSLALNTLLVSYLNDPKLFYPLMVIQNSRHGLQTSADTWTCYCYSSKIRCFVNYSCINLCKNTRKYSLRPRFESELWYSLRRLISKRDPASPEFNIILLWATRADHHVTDDLWGLLKYLLIIFSCFLIKYETTIRFLYKTRSVKMLVNIW